MFWISSNETFLQYPANQSTSNNKVLNTTKSVLPSDVQKLQEQLQDIKEQVGGWSCFLIDYANISFSRMFVLFAWIVSKVSRKLFASFF